VGVAAEISADDACLLPLPAEVRDLERKRVVRGAAIELHVRLRAHAFLRAHEMRFAARDDNRIARFQL
jgi:hypothetical protein